MTRRETYEAKTEELLQPLVDAHGFELVDVEYVKPRRSERVQKIKTDNGIEIIIPVDYMNSKDYVEFVTQSDGTISIQLKNITNITSK